MKIHLIYRRLPNEVIERDDELVADLGKILIAKTEIRGMGKPLILDGEKLIDNGYYMLYFAFMNEKYDILKIYDPQLKFKGIYVDVLKYTNRWDNVIEMLDLFLDILIFPDGRYRLLDKEEIEEALKSGYIEKKVYEEAYATARNIIKRIEKGSFPPEIVNQYDL